MTFTKVDSSLYRFDDKPVTDLDILSYMSGQGMAGTPSSIVFDGNIHRFGTDSTKRNDDAGWYVAVQYPSGTKIVNFGDFRANIHGDYISGHGRNLTESEKLEIEYEIEQAKTKARTERDLYHNSRAKDAENLWNTLSFATIENGYLQRKKIFPHNTKISDDGRLVIPLFNRSGNLRSLQFIPSEEGEKKRFFTGAETKGCFWWLGDAESSRVFLCEGFATAASINEVTGCCTFMSFSASNLPPVAKMLREAGKDVTVVADNDESGTGEEWARRCEGCHVIVIPKTGMDANDYQVETGNLKEILPDLSVVSKMILADDIVDEDLTIHWLIKNWIPADSIGMVHGQSASGKTTIMLDMLLSATSGQPGWCENRIIRPINVVYLCGEGLTGVKRRLRAWKARSGAESLGHFAVYPLPLDLDTPAGVHEIRSQIDILGWNPDLIVIDTVNRYMSGDENSAQDTRTLLNCVDSLRSTYSCSGLYVHHTGNNEEAQKRARGSSAWRGALDFEISVTKLEDNTREIEQVKMKDSELMPKIYGTIEGEPIPGLFDDEGELVTGAVFCPSDAPETTVEKELSDAVSMMFSVYSLSGREDRHIEKEDWVEWLMKERSMEKRKAQKWISDTRPNRPVGRLLESGALTPEGEGFHIQDTPETHMILGFIGGKK